LYNGGDARILGPALREFQFEDTTLIMEQRLFFVSIVIGIYALLTRMVAHKQSLKSKAQAGAWHGLFCAQAAFIMVLVLVTGLDSRSGVSIIGGISKGQAIFASVAMCVAFMWGLFSSLDEKKTVESILKDDLEWADTIFSSILLAVIVMYFLVQAFKIPSGSMRDTLLEGDHLFVNKAVYGMKIPLTDRRMLKFRDIKRGDIVVFTFPSENPAEQHCGGSQYGKDFIKRMMGMPGDTIEMREGMLLINGKQAENEVYAKYSDPVRIPGPERKAIGDKEYQQLWESRNLGRAYGEAVRDSFGPVKVPADSYFAIGDNRDHSCDSRFWGPVPAKSIKGRAMFIYWPPGRMVGVR